MTRRLLPLCALVLAFAAYAGSAPEPSLFATPTEWNQGWFPKGTFGERTDDFVASWYSKHLRAMGEPSLKKAVGEEAAVYRFLWLRTWGQPIAVRIERAKAGPKLVATRLDGSGGYDPGTSVQHLERALTDAEWARFAAALKAADLAHTPTHSDRRGMDGAQWVIEAVEGGKYHIVDRWTPEAEGPDAAFVALCVAMLEISGIEVVGDRY